MTCEATIHFSRWILLPGVGASNGWLTSCWETFWSLAPKLYLFFILSVDCTFSQKRNKAEQGIITFSCSDVFFFINILRKLVLSSRDKSQSVSEMTGPCDWGHLLGHCHRASSCLVVCHRTCDSQPSGPSAVCSNRLLASRRPEAVPTMCNSHFDNQCQLETISSNCRCNFDI